MTGGAVARWRGGTVACRRGGTVARRRVGTVARRRGGTVARRPGGTVTRCCVAVLVLGAMVFLGAGCGPKKPELFRVRGRIIDAEMKQPLSGVRLVLRATFPAGVGKTTLKSFGMTRADGSYDVELAEGFAVLREAAEIGLDAAKPGYTPVSVGVPVPIKSAPFFKLGDIVMKRSAAPLREGPPPAPPPARGLFRDDPPPKRR